MPILDELQIVHCISFAHENKRRKKKTKRLKIVEKCQKCQKQKIRFSIQTCLKPTQLSPQHHNNCTKLWHWSEMRSHNIQLITAWWYPACQCHILKSHQVLLPIQMTIGCLQIHFLFFIFQKFVHSALKYIYTGTCIYNFYVLLLRLLNWIIGYFRIEIYSIIGWTRKCLTQIRLRITLCLRTYRIEYFFYLMHGRYET